MKLKLAGLLLLTLTLSTSACADNGPVTGATTSLPENHYFPVPVSVGDVIQGQDQAYRLDKVVEGLGGIPWGMAFLPDGSILVTERQGDLRIIRNGVLQPEPIKGVPAVFARGQGGLLDVVLHPNYAQNGWVYISYSEPGGDGGNTVIMRGKLRNDEFVDKQVLFRGTPYSNRGHHFGSRITFDRNGYMFFTIGDRGQRSDAQLLTNAAGKSFRLHDDGRVPSDNPFVNNSSAIKAIWTYGNRNQQGIVTHPVTGEIWAHEHGPRGGDEINVLEPGKNFGWPEITFGINYDGTTISTDTARAGMEQPIHYWTPSIGPSGMVFNTGDRYPGWKGDLFSGSLSFQFLQRTVFDGNRVVKEERIAEAIGRVRDVRLAPDGYIYFAVDQGIIYRILPAN